jgi:hypothetical protein
LESSAICLPGSIRRLACRFSCSGGDSGCTPKHTRCSAARMDFQRGRNGGSDCRDNTGYNLWCVGVYGPSLLDTRVLGSGPAGDTLYCVCFYLEALDGHGPKGDSGPFSAGYSRSYMSETGLCRHISSRCTASPACYGSGKRKDAFWRLAVSRYALALKNVARSRQENQA